MGIKPQVTITLNQNLKLYLPEIYIHQTSLQWINKNRLLKREGLTYESKKWNWKRKNFTLTYP